MVSGSHRADWGILCTLLNHHFFDFTQSLTPATFSVCFMCVPFLLAHSAPFTVLPALMNEYRVPEVRLTAGSKHALAG